MMMVFKIAAAASGSCLNISSWCSEEQQIELGEGREEQGDPGDPQIVKTLVYFNLALLIIIFLLFVRNLRLLTEHRMTNWTSGNPW